MLFTNGGRIQNARGGVQRIHSRINPKLCNGARQHGRCIQVSKGCCRCRVGQVIRRHIHGLNRGDRTLMGGGDAFLHRAHIGPQGRLIAHSGGNTAQQSGHFRASLRKAEDVIHEEQHVLAFFITEIFRLGQAGQRHTGTRARRFVHLTVDQRHFRVAFQVDNP